LTFSAKVLLSPIRSKPAIFPAICAAILLIAQTAGAQGLIYISNTNQPVDGTVDSEGFSINFYTGPNLTGYTLTAVSVLFGDNTDTEVTDIHIDINAPDTNYPPVNQYDSGLVNVFTGELPRAAGLYTFLAGTNTEPSIYLPANQNFTIDVSPVVDGPINESMVFAYTTSTNSSDTGGWVYNAASTYDDTDDQNTYPLFNILATPLPPAVLAPIILRNAVVLTNGAFQFMFTNNPVFSFTTYVTTNPALPFTNWSYAGNPVNIGTNWFEYDTPPGVVTNAQFHRLYFRVSCP
jgi:hypothetical protein